MNTAITTNNKYYKSENEKMQIHNFVQSQALFKNALENGLKITESVCKIAAQYGRVEVLKLIKDMGMLYSLLY